MYCVGGPVVYFVIVVGQELLCQVSILGKKRNTYVCNTDGNI